MGPGGTEISVNKHLFIKHLLCINFCVVIYEDKRKKCLCLQYREKSKCTVIKGNRTEVCEENECQMKEATSTEY